LLALGAGNFVKSRELAKKISGTRFSDELAVIFLACDALNDNDFAGAIAYLEKLPAEGFGQYTKPLLTAWALAGQDRKDAALKLLADSSAPDDPTYRIHAGLMEELSGNMNAAADHYQVAMANGLDLHTAVIVGNFFERYGRPEIAASIYKGLDGVYPNNPFITAMAQRDPRRDIDPNITRAADGAALALFDLASLLYGKRAYDSAQIYGSLVQMLDPDNPFAQLMMGDIASIRNQYDRAIRDYNSIRTQSPIFWLAHMRVAEIYEVSGQPDKAIAMLTEMSRNSATRTHAFASLGDIYRRREQFASAVDAYTQALDGIDKLTPDHWSILYARGVSEERLKNWNNAEKDLMQALSFQPNNPTILNFIAYSWATQGIHLDKALEYIRLAAALRPDDGYILDSYGWTLFRMERYGEAIRWLEQSVEQIPNDSTLLDHLGDAYWQVGRHNEARHRWRQAQDLSQDPSFKTAVAKKAVHGIVAPSQTARTEAKF
jgi:Flp pilus assembly protein TadD